MYTKLLMITAAWATGLLGIVASFLPDEILHRAGQEATGLSVMIIQMAGALYIAFATMNWMAKTVLMGGIYARPVCMANFMHFGIAAIVMVKANLHANRIVYILPVTMVFTVFALLFGVVLFRNPGKDNQKAAQFFK